jgi:hypothetical protein
MEGLLRIAANSYFWYLLAAILFCLACSASITWAGPDLRRPGGASVRPRPVAF